MGEGVNTSNIWIDKLGDLGAAVSRSFTKSVTHVVWANGKQPTANKVIAAQSRGQDVIVVSVLWVEACVTSGVMMDTTGYSMNLMTSASRAKKVSRLPETSSVCHCPALP